MVVTAVLELTVADTVNDPEPEEPESELDEPVEPERARLLSSSETVSMNTMVGPATRLFVACWITSFASG